MTFWDNPVLSYLIYCKATHMSGINDNRKHIAPFHAHQTSHKTCNEFSITATDKAFIQTALSALTHYRKNVQYLSTAQFVGKQNDLISKRAGM